MSRPRISPDTRDQLLLMDKLCRKLPESERPDALEHNNGRGSGENYFTFDSLIFVATEETCIGLIEEKEDGGSDE